MRDHRRELLAVAVLRLTPHPERFRPYGEVVGPSFERSRRMDSASTLALLQGEPVAVPGDSHALRMDSTRARAIISDGTSGRVNAS